MDILPKRRILLIEDEIHLQEALRLNFEMEGYEVTVAGDGKSALHKFRGERFNLVVLDVMLPEFDGFRICEIIRLENPHVPILFLTAKSSGEDRVKGLRLGADDYLAKPFNLEELLLRVHNLAKRSTAKEIIPVKDDIFRFGENEINFASWEATGAGKKKIKLTKKEVLLLRLLTDRKNQVVSRETILETIWGYDVYPSTRTIDNFILNFRKYFESGNGSTKYFQSVRGVGYKFSG